MKGFYISASEAIQGHHGLLFSVIRCVVPLPHSNTLQYYVKPEKCKVNNVIFPSGCEVCAINLDNKHMKIGIFIGGNSVRSKNIS